MSEIVNLNRIRKAKNNAKKRSQADENAVKFGRTKVERERSTKRGRKRRGRRCGSIAWTKSEPAGQTVAHAARASDQRLAGRRILEVFQRDSGEGRCARQRVGRADRRGTGRGHGAGLCDPAIRAAALPGQKLTRMRSPKWRVGIASVSGWHRVGVVSCKRPEQETARFLPGINYVWASMSPCQSVAFSCPPTFGCARFSTRKPLGRAVSSGAAFATSRGSWAETGFGARSGGGDTMRSRTRDRLSSSAITSGCRFGVERQKL